MKKVIDNDGDYREIADLEKAITQAKEFSGYRMEEDGYQKTKQRQFIYWMDLWIKLELVKAGLRPSRISLPLRFPHQYKDKVLECLKENSIVEYLSETVIYIYREEKVYAGHLFQTRSGRWQLEWESVLP
ncbi:hypothetical protein WJU16_02940 [Chitinophaga pollutisoli]|uniref:Uncharacterized protein n=1 Tax=Chitinophaga pollutisoli TaxID=3133966 RepID=A0ABZ2YQE0_9BACT